MSYLVAVLSGKGQSTNADTVTIKEFQTIEERNLFVKATECNGKYWTICQAYTFGKVLDLGYENFEMSAWNM